MVLGLSIDENEMMNRILSAKVLMLNRFKLRFY
jgi:hypothetical protein